WRELKRVYNGCDRAYTAMVDRRSLEWRNIRARGRHFDDLGGHRAVPGLDAVRSKREGVMVSRVTRFVAVAGLALAAVASLQADGKKSAEDQGIELIRGLMSEFATVKAYLPLARKALDFESDGTWDKQKWEQEG